LWHACRLRKLEAENKGKEARITLLEEVVASGREALAAATSLAAQESRHHSQELMQLEASLEVKVCCS
jgi:hypothetical protein